MGRPAGDQAALVGERFRVAEEAEHHYVRMSRLRRMSVEDLRALLAGDPADAASWIESAAKYGLTEAQLRLGQMLLDGFGVAKDNSAALTWFTRAAHSGAAEAMNMVGRCHESGWGSPVDLTVAANWYRSSATAGHDWGQYNYANMLFDGRGVDRDQREAIDWYRLAAEQGHARAMNLLARCLEEGWGARRDLAQSYDWYRRSAERGYFRAQYNFATLLAEHGRLEEAMAWFETACRAATPDSLRALVEGLIRRREPRLARLGRRLAADLTVPASRLRSTVEP